MSCCPPDSTPYLIADYATKGSIIDAGGTACYATGATDSATALLIFPDVFGWNSGRIRAVADLLADALGARCYVPKLLQPPLEGGTDGDGLPPNFSTSSRWADLTSWLQGIPWPAVAPGVTALLAHARAGGAARIGVVGFCWGAWACFHADAGSSGGIGAGVAFHPSAHIEAVVHGGDTAALAAATTAPFLLLPAGDDPPGYDGGGEIFEGLGDGSATVRYGGMSHGWVSRGDVTDEDVRRDVEGAIAAAVAFFREKLELGGG